MNLRATLNSVVSAEASREVLFTDSGGRYRLAELLDMSRGLRAELRRIGLAGGDVVLLEFSRRDWPRFVAAYLACQLAGYVTAIVAPETGTRRRELVLDRLAVRCLVRASGDHGDGDYGGDGDSYGGYECEPVAGDSCGPPGPVSHTDGVVVEYLLTSGTTGEPRIVPVDAEARLAPRLATADGARRSGGVVVVSPPGSNAAQTTLAEALLRPGGAIACLAAWYPRRFVALVEASGASGALLAPAMAASLVRSPAFEPRRLRGLTAIRLGMAPADPGLFEVLRERLPWASITNVYTTTEAWPAGTVMHQSTHDPRSVGRPLPGTRVRIVDAHGAVAAPGETGRIHLGYTRVDGTEPSWVDTGDLGRTDESGQLVFAGRHADVVTMGGTLVSLAEVENEMLGTCLVSDAAAFEVSSPVGRRLAAAVVWNEREQPDELRRRVSERLGVDSTPTAVHGVTEIPRDAQGKLLRARLASRYAWSPPDATGSTPATTSVADALLGIWSEVLTHQDVSTQDDFFALGGDSLAATICNALIAERLGVTLPLDSHFDAPGFADLLRLVEVELARKEAQHHDRTG